jgi:hypothetical protein
VRHRDSFAFQANKKAHSLLCRSYFKLNRYDFVTRVHLALSTGTALQQVLNFLYTNQISLDIRNIGSILACADELGVDQLIKHCELSFSKFDKKYLFKIIEIARKHNLSTPYFDAYKHMCTNFDDCVQLHGFLGAPYWLIIDILLERSIKQRDETLLLDRLFKYAIHNRRLFEKNPNYLPNILSEIDFSKINPDDLNSLLANNNSLFSMKNCQSTLSKYFQVGFFQIAKKIKIRSIF